MTITFTKTFTTYKNSGNCFASRLLSKNLHFKHSWLLDRKWSPVTEVS